MDRLFGSHLSMAGGYDKAVRAAGELGFVSVQLFTKNNNQWKGRPLTTEHTQAFQAALVACHVGTPVAHNSYLINLASPDPALWQKSIDAMIDELERAEALGIVHVVAHPGAHMGQGDDLGLTRIAQAIDEVHRRTPTIGARITLETTAGQGTCLGHRFEHLGTIIDRVEQPDRLGICVDSCHIFAAGYRFETLAEYDATIEELDHAVGIDRVKVWHVNDSLRERGSRVDRHAGIGRGKIGLEPFGHLVNDLRFAAVPLILETPKGIDDATGVDLDVVYVNLLRGLFSS